MTGEAAGILRDVPLFQGLSDEALEAVSRRTVFKKYPQKALLFREGETARGLFVIVEGSVEIYRSGSGGRTQLIHVEGPGHSIAELPLFDGGPYPASARAGEDSRVLFLPRDAFEWLYRNNPEVAAACIGELGRRLRKMVRLVDKLALKDVPGRVATTLLERAARKGVARSGGRFVLDSTQEQLASELGTTRESISRALSTLRKRELIAQEGSKVRILDLTGLRDVAQVSLASVTGSVLGGRGNRG